MNRRSQLLLYMVGLDYSAPEIECTELPDENLLEVSGSNIEQPGEDDGNEWFTD